MHIAVNCVYSSEPITSAYKQRAYHLHVILYMYVCHTVHINDSMV